MEDSVDLISGIINSFELIPSGAIHLIIFLQHSISSTSRLLVYIQFSIDIVYIAIYSLYHPVFMFSIL